MFREIMSACLALEQTLRIAYLGPAGTFSHAAVGKHFGTFVEAVPFPTFDDMFRGVDSGQADYAVVPVENSTEGAVGRTLDLMVATDLAICGEVKLRVDQNLLSNAAAIGAVTRVYSHGAVARRNACNGSRSICRAVPRIAVASNAEAARLAAAEAGAAAIAGENAGVDLRARHARAAHRGRAQQHDALLGARAAAGRPVGPRRDVARDVVPQPSGRRARAARALREARRVDVALRVAAGAHRPLGVPVLRRRRRPSRRSAGGGGAGRARADARRSSSCWARTRRRCIGVPCARLHDSADLPVQRSRLRRAARALRARQADRGARARARVSTRRPS